MLIKIKQSKAPSIRVRTQISIPENLSGIDNIDVSQVRDGYILMYDDERQRYVFVDPDLVLSKAVEDNTLPNDFVAKLDTELDNKIDFDGGNF